jgi:prepilin-type N-terminal cleavage/methylation domain-containing protein
MTGRKGFTLIEVLLALVLVSLVLIGTAELLVRAQQISREAETRIRMTDALSAALESLKALPYDDPGLANGEVQTRLEAAGQKTFVLERRTEDVSLDMKRIEMTVYADEARARGIRAVLYISRLLGF